MENKNNQTSLPPREGEQKKGMDKLEIYKFQLDAIAEALRVTAYSYELKSQRTCLGRMVTQAEQYAKNALKGEIDAVVRYGQVRAEGEQKEDLRASSREEGNYGTGDSTREGAA